MRNLEFRVFDTIDKNIIVSAKEYSIKKAQFVLGTESELDDVIRFGGIPELVVDQYTGMLDKNGIKIFENDIIRCNQWNPSDYKIKFGDGSFYLADLEKEEYASDINMIFDSTGIHFEVIGNIHINQMD